MVPASKCWWEKSVKMSEKYKGVKYKLFWRILVKLIASNKVSRKINFVTQNRK